ncbi:ATP-binding protein [Amycolatopsis alba]|uniref:ATP-binding protein n=1 Tax=Amycolatopsis alba DSM 44262 TaxID=1125972 RepID=A0A229RRS8_AMYAL|nr:ATP-binding protein [Amycolatopsis alba]OXM49346.1 ATP-binding protein [Amycolatopsis alba DSM 44262]
MAEWAASVPTDGSVELPPDPRTMEAIGRNHSFETALADLVDNSVDADATHVLIRFVRDQGRLCSLYVVDNGHGIGPERIDEAMTVGGRRAYGEADLGWFGLGLKAASFSQANQLTLLSRAKEAPAVGRRWRIDDAKTRFLCDTVPESFAEHELEQDRGLPDTGSGTIVRWDQVGGFPATDNESHVERFVSQKVVDASNHLGLVFHRIIESGRVTIVFDVQDARSTSPSSPIEVESINPFDYHRTGATGFPKDLKAAGDRSLTFRCHIWPPRSTARQFKLGGRPADHQGMYFYRRDRLLQPGGWEGVHAPHPKLQLARVEVEIDRDAEALLRMNPEKSRVQVRPEFSHACESARAEDGTSFSDYFAQAVRVYEAGNKRRKTRKPMIRPGRGFSPGLRDTIDAEIEALGADPVDIRWRDFDDDRFFDIDRTEQTIWLNKRYRKMLLGDRHAGLNDLPLLKTMIYLLMEDVFQGDYLGSRDKDNIELWKSLLTTAVRAERR